MSNSNLVDLRWNTKSTRYLKKVIRALHEEIEGTFDPENEYLEKQATFLQKIVDSRAIKTPAMPYTLNGYRKPPKEQMAFK